MGNEVEPISGDEIELISDGDGLAVVGNETAVERFMAATGLSKLDSHTLGAVYRAGASVAQKGSELASESGRWVKLTEESATKLNEYGLTPTTTPGVSHAMLGPRGSIKSWLQIEIGPGAMVTNPAMLSGIAGIMAQQAMQQSMAEIAEYLAVIDEKLDDVLRAQTNQVLARMDGVDLAIKEAMSVRASVGRVSEVTWSKVQNSAQTIHETQGYALRQLADLADKLNEKTKVGELAKIAKDAEGEVEQWLTVLARCFQLHDAVGVLELDRVLDSSPDELDRHRLGLRAARQDRLELITERTVELLVRMDGAVDRANSKVLFNPTSSPSVVRSRNLVATDVHDFHGMLGIESGDESSEARRWREAASESWDKARATGALGVDSVKQFGRGTGEKAKSFSGKALAAGAGGVGSAKQLGSTARGQVKSVTGKLPGFAGRKLRRNDDEAQDDGADADEPDEQS
jgi:hypothetical protein